MDIRAVFELSVMMSFMAFGLVTNLYIVPRLRVVFPSLAGAAVLADPATPGGEQARRLGHLGCLASGARWTSLHAF